MRNLDVILSHAAVSVLLIYDFFPNLHGVIDIPKSLLMILMLIAVLFGLFNSSINGEKNNQHYKYQIFSLVYLLALTVLLTILGGHSQVGISIKNPIIWLLAIITLFSIFKNNKRTAE